MVNDLSHMPHRNCGMKYQNILEKVKLYLYSKLDLKHISLDSIMIKQILNIFNNFNRLYKILIYMFLISCSALLSFGNSAI